MILLKHERCLSHALTVIGLGPENRGLPRVLPVNLAAGIVGPLCCAPAAPVAKAGRIVRRRRGLRGVRNVAMARTITVVPSRRIV